MLWEQVETSQYVLWCPQVPTTLLMQWRGRCSSKGIHIRRGCAGIVLQVAWRRWVGKFVLQGLHFVSGLEKEPTLSFRLNEWVMKTFVYLETGSHAAQTDLELAMMWWLILDSWSSCLYLQSARINHMHHHVYLKQYSLHSSDLLLKHKEHCLARLPGGTL